MLENVGRDLEHYMSLLSARQNVVASNIANIDTPGYKTRDVDFQSELDSQLSAAHVVEVQGLATKNDGNNVSLDREARLLAENALRFNIASNLVRVEMREIRAAIQDGKA